jgi:SSS family solute:Na+ symporter
LGDRVFPHFIARQLPPGVAGLLLAALFAAAMSSIDTSLNSSATVILSDFYSLWRRDVGERESMRVLYSGTILVGALGTGTALAMMGVKSVLDAWWTLSGIFAGGMLGLFLLGIISRRAHRAAALTGVTIGILVILWMTLSPQFPDDSPLRSPFHSNMIIVMGTLAIFWVGVLASKLRSIR